LPSLTTAIEAFAPAKVNLTLHVTGQRADGYHLLDSLVVFAGVGDIVRVRPAEGLWLAVEGPMADQVPPGGDNLVLRAARMMGAEGAAITLSKVLPVASGLGGGSSDAAATVRALAQLWRRALPDMAALAALGADVPVCLEARTRRMAGIGEVLTETPAQPPVWLVLANAGRPVPTAAVFGGLARKDGAPMPARLPDWPDAGALARFLALQRNDLEDSACRIAPDIRAVLAALAATGGCLLARMSGSGGTCFGLYAAEGEARHAAAALATDHPGWWVVAAPVLR
jgi:4-diphosphocytidyl-2-C-methyl-D-erythritol kinase